MPTEQVTDALDAIALAETALDELDGLVTAVYESRPLPGLARLERSTREALAVVCPVANDVPRGHVRQAFGCAEIVLDQLLEVVQQLRRGEQLDDLTGRIRRAPGYRQDLAKLRRNLEAIQ
jgi:phage tail protein X